MNENAITGVVLIGFIFSRLATQRIGRAAYGVLIAVIVAATACDFLGSLTPPLRLLFFGVAVAAGLCAAVDAFRFARTWSARARTLTPMVLAPPFHGRWRVAAGGAFAGLNHHTGARAQHFAYDFVRLGDRSFGSTIVAPLSGEVIAACDGMPDRKASLSLDDPSVRGRAAGNHVVIADARGVVYLAHLQCGSVRVRAGDHVTQGDVIGACGNSGRRTRPHLHLHAQGFPPDDYVDAQGPGDLCRRARAADAPRVFGLARRYRPVAVTRRAACSPTDRR